MTDTWNTKNYSQFLDARTRPARDLLAAIPASFQPHIIYDLGCGPGNSTALLKNRWPNAEVTGLDNSAAMLEEAKKKYPSISFIEGDIADFSPSEKIDCLFANASLQWLTAHDILIPKLLQLMNTGGMFAFQMPNNFHSPSHQVTVNILQNNSDWQDFLKHLRYGLVTEPLYNLTWYYDLLTKAGATSLQLWETEYFQEMPDYQAIFDWVKGTALNALLTVMDVDNQIEFAHAYIDAISKAYPLQTNNKVLLPFKRVFMVGQAGRKFCKVQ